MHRALGSEVGEVNRKVLLRGSVRGLLCSFHDMWLIILYHIILFCMVQYSVLCDCVLHHIVVHQHKLTESHRIADSEI